ncbi:sulfatase family protein [Saccharicrinis fermentans]|uniref:Arylsulfatase n=1 Tax=Saccharicrinis fermentans DSM 9555 = JCM 21142 TaxID=869213 RepID=W7YMM1_9BACT|nr:sulfatase [Saccharicrinis fermentans]GAF03639.1 arylsulfatase [Saccharicrinis fermentans DSM 9555 = JCM 21142]
MKLQTILLLALVATLPLVKSDAKKSKRPNIIFIMADDHTSQSIGAYGGRLARLNPTPNLDKLASEGMLFENAFCNNSICSPSRASIISGQYSQTNGVLDLDHHLDVDKQYLPIEMKKLGYSTAIIGKWHLGNEPVNFDYYKVLPVQGKYFNPVFREKGKGTWPNNLVKTEGHSSDVITDLSIDYLEKLDKSKPFFLMHHYKAPHDMFEYAPRYKDYLADVEIPEPASLYNQPFFGSEATRGRNDSLRHVIGTSISPRNTQHNRHSSYTKLFYGTVQDKQMGTHLAYQKYLKDYLRCVKGVDDNLGRLFAYLKKEGLWENTVIIYTGDQGMMLGEHDFADKRWMYEETMRMPFIVHYPAQIKKEQKTALLINNTDYAPTMIELAGGKAPEYMQGKSFISTLMGKEETEWREATYYRYWMHIIHHFVPAHFGIRTKDYKLIFYYGKHYLPKEEFESHYWADRYNGVGRTTPAAWEFYDLKNDPQELHNRYNDPKYKELIAKLKVELKRQRKN